MAARASRVSESSRPVPPTDPRKPDAAPDEGPAGAGPPRGRWAPSPTGPLHLGSARTALVAWLSVRTRGGALVWRIEDLDRPRAVPGAAEGRRLASKNDDREDVV